MNPQLTKHVIDSFSTENSVKKYTQDVKGGLWESEKILIERYFPTGSSILDLGCGVGRTTIPLHLLGYKITGTDVTPKFIKLAQELAQQKQLNITFEVEDATHLSFKDNSFDNALFSFNGWSMIPSKEGRLEAAKEIYRTLKPEGYFIFTFHKRQFFGQELVWTLQAIRLYVLKPLGYKTKELDFGDFYFNRDSETTYPIEQFVSFLSVKEVKEIMEGVGFKVEIMKMRSELTKEDAKLTSGDVMFCVCRK
jgi:ubiquinone/menaquinone biosynthesis C-methylase UbiE